MPNGNLQRQQFGSQEPTSPSGGHTYGLSEAGSSLPTVGFNAVSEHPLSLSTNTTGSFAQTTAWKTPRSGARPLAQSSQTGGSTFKFDAGDNITPPVEIK